MAATGGLLGSSSGENSSSMRVSTRFGESRSIAIRADGELEVTSFRSKDGIDLRPDSVKWEWVVPAVTVTEGSGGCSRRGKTVS